MSAKRYFRVNCEAPGGFGPKSVLEYDEGGHSIARVDHLDLEFEVWLGDEIVTCVGHYCVSEKLWEYLVANGIKGVSVREMTVSQSEDFDELCPGVVIPPFKELVVPQTLRGNYAPLEIEAASIPNAETFRGPKLPLIVTERIRNLLVAFGLKAVIFEEARVV